MKSNLQGEIFVQEDESKAQSLSPTKYTFIKRVFPLLALLLILVAGCSPSYDEDAGYEKSIINESFPVPANAEQVEAEFANPNIEKGVKYNLPKIGGHQGLYPPERYFQEIEKWGWDQLTDKQMGDVHFFKRGETVISVVIKENSFEVYEMKKDAEF